METSKEFRMNKVVNYVNNNIDELKQKLNNQINWWNEDQDHVINDMGFDTLNDWTDFCLISTGEHVLTKTGFAFMSDEDYRMTLLDKVEELINN